MSVEAWTITPQYTISGTGPYAISHPYVTGAIRAYVQLPTGRLELNGSEFAVSPEASDTTGNLSLSPTAATAHAGLKLIIDRITPDEQGWLAVQGEREAGLAAQLDRMVQSTQELRARGAGALRTRNELEPFDWAEGTVPILEGGKPKSGPTAAAIAGAQSRAAEAAASAAAAAASAAEALAKQNSMLRDRGAWATLTLYSPSDIFTSNGTSYITQTSHIASSIAADLAAGRIRVFAAKGDAGAGTGDMLKTENLSGLPNVPQARTNLGLQALAIKALAAFSDLDPAAVITDVERLFANKVQNAVPVAKAVTDALDALLIVVDERNSGTQGGTFSNGAWRTRVLNTVRRNTIPGALLSANRITLPAGTYKIDASAPALRVNSHSARLLDLTSGFPIVAGTSEISEQAGAIVSSRSHVRGTFTLSVTSELEIQHCCQTSFSTQGFGQAVAFAGTFEVYTIVEIRQIG